MTPSLITLYANTSQGRIAAARFRWSPETGVSLETLDPQWGQPARECYEEGVPYVEEERVVLPAEGELFMEAILLTGSTYLQFVDESSDR